MDNRNAFAHFCDLYSRKLNNNRISKFNNIDEGLMTILSARIEASPDAQKECQNIVQEALDYHIENKVQNRRCSFRFHYALYVAALLSFRWKLNESVVVAALLDAINSCERNFYFFLGTVMFTGFVNNKVVFSWNLENEPNRNKVKSEILQYFLHHSSQQHQRLSPYFAIGNPMFLKSFAQRIFKEMVDVWYLDRCARETPSCLLTLLRYGAQLGNLSLQSSVAIERAFSSLLMRSVRRPTNDVGERFWEMEIFYLNLRSEDDSDFSQSDEDDEYEDDEHDADEPDADEHEDDELEDDVHEDEDDADDSDEEFVVVEDVVNDLTAIDFELLDGDDCNENDDEGEKDYISSRRVYPRALLKSIRYMFRTISQLSEVPLIEHVLQETNFFFGLMEVKGIYLPLTTHDIVPADRYMFPAKLQHLCRCAIRERLNENWQLPDGIQTLPVSGILKKYLDILID